MTNFAVLANSEQGKVGTFYVYLQIIRQLLSIDTVTFQVFWKENEKSQSESGTKIFRIRSEYAKPPLV